MKILAHRSKPGADPAQTAKAQTHLASVVLITFAMIAMTACSPSLHDAIARGNLETAQKLLERNPALAHDLDAKFKTPLHKAVTYKQQRAMEMLLKADADVDAPDITGMTPLHVAAMLGRLEETEWLLAHGADPTLTDHYGDMPIHTAAIFGHGHIIGFLVRTGMNPDIPNAEGQLPREIARAYRQDRVAEYLEHLLRRSS